jgi:hypothetical protein
MAQAGNRSRVGRLAMGTLVLVAERLGVAGAREGVATAAGLAERTADGVGRAVEFAVGAVTLARLNAGAAADRVRAAGRDRVTAVGTTGRDRIELVRATGRDQIAAIRRQGDRTVEASRAEALAFLQASVDDGVAWAQVNVVPRVVDGLVPHLIDEVVPRIIEGSLPEIRERVVPPLVDDLANDPRLRELIREQARGVLGDAAHEIRTGTAAADDRVERAYRRVFGNGQA